jgi:hypothetical protein
LQIGCVDALIVDDESRALVFGAGGGSGAVVPSVICRVADGSPAPACAEVAATYLRTTTVPTPFFIAAVMSSASGAYLCQRRFSRDGVDQGGVR